MYRTDTVKLTPTARCDTVCLPGVQADNAPTADPNVRLDVRGEIALVVLGGQSILAVAAA